MELLGSVIYVTSTFYRFGSFHGYGDPKSKEYFNALIAMIESRPTAEQDMFVDLINMHALSAS